MGALEIGLRLFGGVVLILANAFFVVTEFALTRLRQFDESNFKDHKRLKLAWRMTEKLEIYLTGCQLGISSTSVLLGVICEPAVTYLITPLMELLQVPDPAVPAVSITVGVIAINLIHKIWGEQAPTYLGVERPIEVARWTAAPHYYWCWVMNPIIKAGDGLAKWTLKLFGVEIRRSWLEAEDGEGEGEGGDSSEGESGKGSGDSSVRPGKYASVRSEMGEILTRGGVPRDRREEVIRALEIDEIPVRKIMVPRQEIVWIAEDASLEDSLKTMADRRRLVRFPLVGKSLEDVRGTIYLADVFHHLKALESGEKHLSDIAQKGVTVPGDLPVSQLIDRFQEENQELALVTGDDDRVEGLVTVTEALEAIAGQIKDPFDPEVEAKGAFQ